MVGRTQVVGRAGEQHAKFCHEIEARMSAGKS